jgi:hypothetical protein
MGKVSAQDDGSFTTDSTDVVELEGEEYDEDQDENSKVTHTLVEPESMEGLQQYKQQRVNVKKFDKSKWRKVAGNVDFSEEEDEEEKQTEDGNIAPVSAPPWSGGLLKIIAYIAIFALVVFILYYILKNTSLKKNPKIVPLEESDLGKDVQNIEDLDIESLLRQALENRNYRIAIRLYYLDLLKRLNAAGIITWKRDKTNRDYLTEIFSRDFHYDDIRKLTIGYETVWYGEHEIPEERMRGLISGFDAMQEKIQPSTNQ